MALDLTTLGGYGDSTIDGIYGTPNDRDYMNNIYCDVAFEVCMVSGEIGQDSETITDGGDSDTLDYYMQNGSLLEETNGIHNTNVLFSYDSVWQDGSSSYYSFTLDVGDELLIHNFALKDTSCTDDNIISQLGAFQIVKLVEKPKRDWGTGSEYLIDGDYSTDRGHVKFYFDRYITVDLDHFYVQAVVVQRYRNLSIATEYCGFKMKRFNEHVYIGGVRVIKCNGTFTMKDGASIDLRRCGLDPYYFPDPPLDANRPLLPHERSGTGQLDVDPCAGAENSITHDHLLLNVGDGAIMIIAKNIVFEGNGTARIGNPNTQGVHYCRGADDSPNKPEGVTNIGGSTIFIAADLMTGFDAKIFAKYRTGTSSDGNGKGLARCYIAVSEKTHESTNYHLFPQDEGLYSIDVLHRDDAITHFNGIVNFGGGGDGRNWLTPAGRENLFNRNAKVTYVGNGYVDIGEISRPSDSELTFCPKFEVGTLVMVHITKTGTDRAAKGYDGIFSLGRITRIDGSRVYLDRGQIENSVSNSNAYAQILTIPELSNYTVEGTIKPYEGFDAEKGYGGIIALAVSGTLDLRGGKINTEGKGFLRYFQNEFDGNKHMNCRLPIGSGHGSVFILAKEIIMDTDTRIGATYTGSAYGGTGGYGGGYVGGGYHGRGDTRGGHGGAAGVDDENGYEGGWHGNATGANTYGGRQGAHIFIVADKITGFNLAAISTGGEGGFTINSSDPSTLFPELQGSNGGAGYGGGGGSIAQGTSGGGGGGFQGGGCGGGNYTNATGNSYTAYGGGAAGGCFIYCNQYVNANFTNIVMA